MATPSFPKFPSFPTIDLSTLPSVDTDAITTAAKDAFYVTVGLGVLAYQKAQVRRQEMTKAFNDQFGNGKAQLDALEARFDGAVDELEKRLPEKAGALLGQAHDAAKAARKQVRELVSSAA